MSHQTCLALTAGFSLEGILQTLRMARLSTSAMFRSKARPILRRESSFGLGCDDSKMLIVGWVNPAFFAKRFMEMPCAFRAALSKRTSSLQVAARISSSDTTPAYLKFCFD